MASTGRYVAPSERGAPYTVRLQGGDMVRMIHGVNGYFQTGVQHDLVVAHEQMAERVQRYAVQVLDERRAAKPRRNDLLEQSILDQRNREVTARGFQVGLPGWLEELSPARRYARRIEDNPEGFGNPMAMPHIGDIIGFFPEGTYRFVWRQHPGSGFRIKPEDRISRTGGYHMHREAGARFLANQDEARIYGDVFGVDFLHGTQAAGGTGQ